MQFRNRWLLAAATGALLFAQSQIALAQQVTASLRGHLTGANGEEISGAQIHVIDTKTGATIDTTTGDGGTFSLAGLAIGGPYSVKIDAPGYSEKTVTGIYLDVGQTSSLELALASLQVETVVVSGQKATAAASLVETRGVATNFDSKAITATPSNERDLKDIVQRAPYAFVDPVGGGSNPPVPTLNIAGANPRCTNLLVDGLQQKDNFGLNLSGYPTQRAPIPTDWDDQIQIAPIPYDVEYNDTCGGVINIVTKSGDNDFHGSAYGYYEDASLNGRQFGQVTSIPGVAPTVTNPAKPPFQEKSYGGTLSGPIVEDHLFFFLGYDELKQEQLPAQNAVGPVGSGFTRIAPGITEAEVQQVESITKNVYGFNPGDLNDTFPLYNQRYIGKLEWQINDDQRLIGTYQHVAGGQLSVQNGNTGSTTPQVSLPSDWFNNEEKLETYSLQYLANWTASFSTQVYAGHIGINDIQAPLDGTDFPLVLVRVPGANGNFELGTSTTPTPSTSDDGYIAVGPDFSRQYNFLFYSNNFVKGVGNLVVDTHTIKFGTEYHQIHVIDKFIQGAQSVVRFDSISDYQNGIIATTLDTRSNAVGGASGINGVGDPVAYKNGIGGVNSVGDGNFTFGIGSLFAQDDWYPTNDLSVEYGLRYDDYVSNDHPVANPNFQQRYGFSNTRNLDGLATVMPRVSVSYNLPLDNDYIPGTTARLRAGVGKFSGGFQTVWVTNSFDTTGVQTLSTAGIPGFNAAGMPVAPGTPCSSAAPFACVPGVLPTNHQQWLADLNNGPLAQASTAANSEVDPVLPSFHLPYVWKQNIGADINFGPGWLGENWVGTFDYFATQDFSQPFWTNLRIEPSNKTAPDGRIIYQWKFDQAAGRPDPAGQPGQITGADIGMGSANGGGSSVFVVDFKNHWDDTGWGDYAVDLGYAHTNASEISAATSAVANSNFVDQARVNFNNPDVGRSNYARDHRVTLDVDATEHWFGTQTGDDDDWATHLDVFGQRMSGERFSYVFNANPFGPFNPAGTASNGGVNFGSLFYVPAADGNGNVTATSDPRVVYAAGFNVAGFNQMLHQTGLIKFAGSITPRNAFSGRWDSLVNLDLTQDIPSYTDYGHLTASMDIFNFLNLLNHNWGVLQEPNFPQTLQAGTVTIVGNQYKFTAFPTAATIQNSFATSRQSSTYQIEFGLHYTF